MKYKIGLLVVIGILLFGVGYFSAPKLQALAGSNFAYNYFTGITSATSSIPMVVTSSTPAIYSGVSYVADVEVCNTQTNPAFLYLVDSSTATTTGMIAGLGTWLDGRGNTTSTPYVCRQFVKFKGDIRGIANTTTTVEVNYTR